MFLFAFAAACAPAQADALNDLSSTPPVSSARHALVAVAAVAAGAAPNASAAAAKTATNLIVLHSIQAALTTSHLTHQLGQAHRLQQRQTRTSLLSTLLQQQMQITHQTLRSL